MLFRRLWLMLLLCLLFILFSLPTQAQDSLNELVTLRVEAGYDHFYRPNYWMPLRVHVSNQGDSFNGRITVRPETSGRVVSNAYSTPIELPNGSEKDAFLYVQARELSSRLVIELLDDEGFRRAEAGVGIAPLEPHDNLYVVVSNRDANSIPLADANPGGYRGATVRWTVDHLPSQSGALEAVDVLVIYDVESDQLRVGQREAIEAWVAMGGQLIIVGGSSWQPTAAAFEELLPFEPQDSQSIEDLNAFAAYVGDDEAELTAQTIITTGAVLDEGRVLFSTADDLPLVIRRDYGTGVIDYLTVDPTRQPLRSWNNLPDFWYTLMTNRGALPGWNRGFLDLQEAARSMAILPDVELLPPVSSMIAFIGAYILLIGPVNYWILSRFRRTAWAWFTIPIFIVGFTIVAWTVGFSLRGSEIIVSRLNIIQSYTDSDTARLDQLVGVLSPRRATYQMDMPEHRMVRVIPGLQQNSLLQPNISVTAADVVQTDNFAVENITIDGGIFANFSAIGTVERPDISGSVTLSYDTNNEDGGQRVLGSLRNDSDITLENTIVIMRNQYYTIGRSFTPGDSVTFNSSNVEVLHENSQDIMPLSSVFEMAYDLDISNASRNVFLISASLVTPRLIIGQDPSIVRRTTRSLETEELSEEEIRRFALLRSFARDAYSTQNIGHNAYLLGWTNTIEDGVAIEDIEYRPVDSALYIIELDVTIEEPASSDIVTIQPDQFTWSVRERDNAEGFVNDVVIINPGSVHMRFTPLEGAKLNDIQYMTIELDRSSSYGREVEFFVYDWRADEWVFQEFTARETYEFDNPARFIGPNNVVDIRLRLDDNNLQSSAASARIRGIKITQSGTF